MELRQLSNAHVNTLRLAASGSVALFCSTLIPKALMEMEARQEHEDSAPESAFKIEKKVNLVLVPVIVRDAHGDLVGNLKKEDFRVFDNGKAQVISGFTVQTRAKPAELLPHVPDESVKPPIKQQRFVIYLFDDCHLSVEDLAVVKKAGVKMLAESLTDSDIAAVLSFSGVNSGLTQDRAKLQEAVTSLRTNGLYQHITDECPDLSYYQADLIQNKSNELVCDAAVDQTMICANLMPQARKVAVDMIMAAVNRVLAMGEQVVRATLAVLADTVRKMGELPGERILIFVSPGFSAVSEQAILDKSKLMDIAARANVTINALDARGLYSTSMDARGRDQGSGRMTQMTSLYRTESIRQNEDVLAELADGRTFFHNRNDLQAGLNLLSQAPDFLYLLEFSPEQVKQDGTFHYLRVKIDRHHLELKARRGYFVPKPDKNKK
jgi:VWFA-related protein